MFVSNFEQDRIVRNKEMPLGKLSTLEDSRLQQILYAYIMFISGPVFYLEVGQRTQYYVSGLDFLGLLFLGAILFVYVTFSPVAHRKVVFGTVLVGFVLHSYIIFSYGNLALFFFLTVFSWIFIGLIYVGKLGNVTIVVPLISIIEIEALYWLLFRNTLLRYAFVSTSQPNSSEF
jgi:hypothetical protein